MGDTRHAATRQFPSLKERFCHSEPLLCTWLSLGSPALCEMALDSSPCAIIIDRQHGLWGRGEMEAAIGVAHSHVPVIVRCSANDPHAIGESLDAGASSVLVPLIESASETRRAVRASRYPPEGSRSGGGIRPLAKGVNGMLDEGQRVTVGIMIETVEGVEHAEDILGVEGLDYVFIGTGDLNLSRGPDSSEMLEGDYRTVLSAARKHKIRCGIFTTSASDAAARLAQGFDMVVAATDTGVFASGLGSVYAELRRRESTC
ncbi:HpcH/HpaI aldolase family protein [Paraburkholderia diazotrophica]|uniref:2-dehydro-3-deoxyglucarate aldolase/4-hydroxy-2-oxoheptanedioate aldolase n=1 Tax=Paraburkholderia diazotrophica TaxID=667676 RepID=A0A1H7CH35_9BURK|nr:aldolase/citrate lyase family protein [Paraburkholderia diazotrophica]SEJ88574.1 2-dehydro-3-deoxyglucarate aldolase/4-hydroxy-2-oxoheptanedioate aldolase [Paraburkholderia diazotrophica]